MELLNINKYTSFFHDGLIYNCEIFEKNVVITMCSAQLDEYENEDNFHLDPFNMIRGKLHIINVNRFAINKEISSLLKLNNNLADIHDLELNYNLIKLNISWVYTWQSNIFQTLEFISEGYFFENLPTMVLPGDEDFDKYSSA